MNPRTRNILTFSSALAAPLALTYCVVVSNSWAAEQYWIKTHDAQVVDAVVVVDNIYVFCNFPHKVLGCTARSGYGGVVLYIAQDAPDKVCIESHERKHAAGFSHHDRPHNQVVC